MEAKYPKDSPHTAKHSKRSYTAYSLLKITFLVLFFINTSNVSAQWNNYQVFESFGTSIPTSGGTWTDNSVTYATVAQAWSGGNQLEMDAAGDYIQTPLISTPAKFTFYYTLSGGVGP